MALRRIASRNDGLVAQAGTTRDTAKLVSLIMTDRLLDSASCAEMRGRLARAAKGPDTPWVARTGIFKPGTITHNKLGLGPLKSGKIVRSEVSVYQSPVAKGRRYVVAWQNLVGLRPIGFADIAKIIRAATIAKVKNERCPTGKTDAGTLRRNGWPSRPTPYLEPSVRIALWPEPTNEA